MGQGMWADAVAARFRAYLKSGKSTRKDNSDKPSRRVYERVESTVRCVREF